jgi:pSer/pThr/pTyr-binding forkhead associated (FHA) protein
MKLKVQISANQVLELESLRSSVTVGRSPNCDLVIPHDSVSRTHCKIEVNAKGVFQITDLDSSNGTYIDGDRLAPHTPASMLSVSQLTIGRLAGELTNPPVPPAGPARDSDTKSHVTQKLVRGELSTAQRKSELGVNDPAEIRRLEGTRTRIQGPRNPVSEEFALEEKELFFRESKRPYILMFVVVLIILMYLLNLGIK